MPYILPEDRSALDGPLDQVAGSVGDAGALNYAITRLVHQYVARRGTKEKPLSYATLNEVMGALACVQQELYRRIVAPYEDEKITDNGDVGVLGRR